MKDLLEPLIAWLDAGEDVAIARIVQVQGSAPLGPGAAMLVTASESVVGSLSSGCVDPTVYEKALEVAGGAPSEFLRFGPNGQDPFTTGLSCGGSVDVFIHHVEDGVGWRRVLDAVREDRPVALTTWLEGPLRGRDEVSFEEPDGPVLTSGGAGDRRFVQPFPPRRKMYIVGANDFGRALARVAKLLDYHVTLCGPSKVFATPQRFPEADEVVAEWPDDFLSRAPIDGRTVIVMMSHDHRFEVSVLQIALDSKAQYVGALGSLRTQAARLRLLQERGVDEEHLERLRGPVGLDVGARTPQEVAIAVAAELLRDRTGATGVSLSEVQQLASSL
jgi:xanthine dehydrogenase accessory factor